MGRKTERWTGSGNDAETSDIKLVLTIPVDSEGRLDTGQMETAFTVDGEVPPELADIAASAREQVGGIIITSAEVVENSMPLSSMAQGKGSAGGWKRIKLPFYDVTIHDFTAGLMADSPGGVGAAGPAKQRLTGPTPEAVRREHNEYRLVLAIMDLPECERRELKREFIRLLNSGSLPGGGLLAEEQHRTGFTDPAVQRAFRNFLWGKLLKDGPQEQAAFAAYYHAKQEAWWDRQYGRPAATEKAVPGGFEPSARGLSPEQEARLVGRWLAAAE